MSIAPLVLYEHGETSVGTNANCGGAGAANISNEEKNKRDFICAQVKAFRKNTRPGKYIER